MRGWWTKMGNLLRRKRYSGELDEEMAFHREQLERELREQGKTAEEARYAAMRQFGNTAREKDRSHEVMGFRMETVAQDARFALRQLGKNPGFATTVILMLALGIGASTAIFAFVDAALIQPLPYAQPNRLVDVAERSAVFPRSNLSRLDFDDWKKMNTSLSSVAAYSGTGYLLRTGTVSEPVPAGRVSDSFFRTLGVQPILGRDFRPGEDEQGQPKVALLSYGAWMQRFGGRRNAVGETISLDGEPYTVVGVLPKDFAFAPRPSAQLWTPLGDRKGCEARRSCHDLYAVGRLRDGVTEAMALADLRNIAAQLEKQYPGSNQDQGASVQPLRELIVGQVRPMLMTMLAGALLLLVIACVNVANLLVVRSETRRREVAVRGALGATPARLVRQFLTEAALLAAAGCGTGVVLALGTMRLLRALMPKLMVDNAPFLAHLGLHAHTAEFAGSVALLAAGLMALTPVARLARQDIHEALSEGGRGAAGRFWRRLGANLVVAELAVAMVLLASAGLLGKSLYRLLHVELGFDASHTATVNVMAPDKAYPKPENWLELYPKIRERVLALPGVQAVGITSDLPVQCNCDTDWIRIPGRPYHGEHNEVMERDVNPEYLPQVLKARLLEGRFFADTDDLKHPRVTVINETMAKKYFPGEDPVGKMIGGGDLDANSMRQVVGVIADIRENALDDARWPVEYFSIYHEPDSYVSLAVRTAGDENALLPELVKAVKGIDGNLGVYGESGMETTIKGSPTAVIHQFLTWLVGGFAAMALVLGVIGLYGVIAYSVGQRTREIGVRMALGAQRSAVHGMILKEAALLAGIGIVLGLGCSIGAATLMGKLLFGVRAWDVATLAGVAGVLGSCALLASLIPAGRAARVNPVDALRAE
jgi:macrolide transport system ATP-binding/permease protein